MDQQRAKICELCGLEADLTRHHLVPQNVSRTAKHPKSLKTDESNFLWICTPCHQTLHAYFSNQELRDFLSTKEAILANDKFAAFLKWRRKHPNFAGHSKMSNSRK